MIICNYKGGLISFGLKAVGVVEKRGYQFGWTCVQVSICLCLCVHVCVFRLQQWFLHGFTKIYLRVCKMINGIGKTNYPPLQTKLHFPECFTLSGFKKWFIWTNLRRKKNLFPSLSDAITRLHCKFDAVVTTNHVDIISVHGMTGKQTIQTDDLMWLISAHRRPCRSSG